MNPYEEGYYAGLINEREAPAALSWFEWSLWMLGNAAGLNIHCAIVEAVYLREFE